MPHVTYRGILVGGYHADSASQLTGGTMRQLEERLDSVELRLDIVDRRLDSVGKLLQQIVDKLSEAFRNINNLQRAGSVVDEGGGGKRQRSTD